MINNNNNNNDIHNFNVKDTLLKVIPSAIKLSTYIDSIITLKLKKRGATDSLIQYLNKIQILPENNYDNNNQTNSFIIDTPNQDEQRSTMNEILSRFINIQLKNIKDYRQQNCIILGYRTKSMNSTSNVRSNSNLECYHINTLHNYFNNTYWSYLAYELGENVIKHLLSRPMFLSIDNGCYLQLTGIPVFESLRVSNLNTQNTLETTMCIPPNGSCTSNGIGNSIGNSYRLIVTPSTLIPRQVMFYNSRYEKSPGLPSSHAINKKVLLL